MKSLIFLPLLVILLCCSVFAQTPTQTPAVSFGAGCCGDCNEDGYVTYDEVSQIGYYIVGLPYDCPEARMNCDGNNEINVVDMSIANDIRVANGGACPGYPTLTPTPTMTPTPAPTFTPPSTPVGVNDCCQCYNTVIYSCGLPIGGICSPYPEQGCAPVRNAVCGGDGHCHEFTPTPVRTNTPRPTPTATPTWSGKDYVYGCYISTGSPKTFDIGMQPAAVFIKNRQDEQAMIYRTDTMPSYYSASTNTGFWGKDAISSFGQNGFSIGGSYLVNKPGVQYCYYAFRNKLSGGQAYIGTDKYVGDGTTPRTIELSSLSADDNHTLGTIMIRSENAGDELAGGGEFIQYDRTDVQKAPGISTVLDVIPDQDTYIDSANNATNYDSSLGMFLGKDSNGEKRVLIHFPYEVTAIKYATHVYKATLIIRHSPAAKKHGIILEPIADSTRSNNATVPIPFDAATWSESQSTWDDRLTGTPWGEIGGQGTWCAMVGKFPILTGTVEVGATETQIDVTDAMTHPFCGVIQNGDFVNGFNLAEINNNEETLVIPNRQSYQGAKYVGPVLRVEYSTGATPTATPANKGIKHDRPVIDNMSIGEISTSGANKAQFVVNSPALNQAGVNYHVLSFQTKKIYKGYNPGYDTKVISGYYDGDGTANKKVGLSCGSSPQWVYLWEGAWTGGVMRDGVAPYAMANDPIGGYATDFSPILKVSQEQVGSFIYGYFVVDATANEKNKRYYYTTLCGVSWGLQLPTLTPTPVRSSTPTSPPTATPGARDCCERRNYSTGVLDCSAPVSNHCVDADSVGILYDASCVSHMCIKNTPTATPTWTPTPTPLRIPAGDNDCCASDRRNTGQCMSPFGGTCPSSYFVLHDSSCITIVNQRTRGDIHRCQKNTPTPTPTPTSTPTWTPTQTETPLPAKVSLYFTGLKTGEITFSNIATVKTVENSQ